MDRSINVIYIAGDVRSGTTLLDLMISDHSRVLSLGELGNLEDYIEKKGFFKYTNWVCSCGENVKYCKFWSKLIIKFGENSIKTKVNSSYNNKSNLVIARNCWKIFQLAFESYKKIDYVLDSSKRGEQLYYLNETKGKSNLTVIFIIRDIRAVANSRVKWNTRFNIEERYPYFRNLCRCFLANLKIINFLSRNKDVKYVIVKYESLASNPKNVINNCYNFLNLEYDSKQEIRINVEDKHNIGGTPNIIKMHCNPIKLDESWRNNFRFNKMPIVFLLGKIFNFLLIFYVKIKGLKFEDYSLRF